MPSTMIEQVAYYTGGLIIFFAVGAGVVAFLFGEWIHHISKGE